MIEYRTETYSGSYVRDVTEVFLFEIKELGNTDILETLKDSLYISDSTKEIIKTLIREIEDTGFVDDMSDDDFTNVVIRPILKDILSITGKDIRYAVWLTSYNAVKQIYAGREDTIDAYETSSVILSDLGVDGRLYGYEMFPMPLSITNN